MCRVEDLSCNPSGANFVAALSSARRDAGQLVLYNLKTFKMEVFLVVNYIKYFQVSHTY